MNVTILSGSARKDNNTIRAAKAINNSIIDSVLVDFQNYDLPSFAETSIKVGQESSFQGKLIESIDQANLMFVLTPEYNWFPSAEIVNTIHQLACNDYKHIFDNLVVATIGVSAGRGGRMPAVQLSYVFNKIFNFFNLNSITSPKTFEFQEITKCIGVDGALGDNVVFNQGFQEFLDYNIKVAKRWQLGS